MASSRWGDPKGQLLSGYIALIRPKVFFAGKGYGGHFEGRRVGLRGRSADPRRPLLTQPWGLSAVGSLLPAGVNLTLGLVGYQVSALGRATGA